MIEAVSRGIAKWLVKAGAIPQEDATLYEYAAYSLMFNVIPICLIVVIGSFLGMLLEGVLMIAPFILLRKFSGGFHLHSSIVCLLSSITLLSLFLLAIRYVMQAKLYVIYSILVFFSTIFICVLSPIDSEDRKLSDKERKAFGQAARLISLLVCFIYGLLLAFGKTQIAVPTGAGLLITALLQSPCLFHRGKDKKNVLEEIT